LKKENRKIRRCQASRSGIKINTTKLPSLSPLYIYDFDLRASHARTLLPAALASVPFGFVLVRVRVQPKHLKWSIFLQLIRNRVGAFAFSQSPFGSISHALPLILILACLDQPPNRKVLTPFYYSTSRIQVACPGRNVDCGPIFRLILNTSIFYPSFY